MRGFTMLFIVLLALLGASHCATTSKQADDKTVCKETEVVGSHITQKVCQTPEQARQREMADQAGMERFQRSNSVVIK